MTGIRRLRQLRRQPNCGAITVENAGGSNRTQVAAYVLLSYGPDGHGGYTKSGTHYKCRLGQCRRENQRPLHQPGADNGFTPPPMCTRVTQTSPAIPRRFDDIVRYKERWQMQDAYDTYQPQSQLPCTNGFR